VKRGFLRRPKQGNRLAQIIFVTGTDTGAGKTLLTALLLHHLRRGGCHALAMKPFCSGGSHDVDLLSELQAGELSREEICPFYFTEPLAPLLAARKHRRQILPDEVLERIRAVQTRCEYLLIEGSGGLMVPLGENFFVADLISQLDCNVLVAAQNKLGVINHTLLTWSVLALYRVARIKIALLGCKRSDLSAGANARILGELLAPMKVIRLPFLGVRADTARGVKRNCRKIKKTLALMLDFATFRPLFITNSRKAVRKDC